MKFHELTAAALSGVSRNNSLVLVPIAAVEQHGPHMPTGTDTILCTAVAEAVEARLSDRLLLTPTMWLGASAHHLRFGATLDAALPHYIDMLMDIARSLLGDGFRRILFLNGHGGNVDPMRVALRRLQADHPESLLAAGCYWDVATTERESILEGEHRFVGHACEFETSLILHLRRELVDQSNSANAGELVPDNVGGMFVGRDMKHRTREGFTGRPDLATAEKGQALFEAITAQLCAGVERLLDQPLTGEYAGFFDQPS